MQRSNVRIFEKYRQHIWVFFSVAMFASSCENSRKLYKMLKMFYMIAVSYLRLLRSSHILTDRERGWPNHFDNVPIFTVWGYPFQIHAVPAGVIQARGGGDALRPLQQAFPPEQAPSRSDRAQQERLGHGRRKRTTKISSKNAFRKVCFLT